MGLLVAIPAWGFATFKFFITRLYSWFLHNKFKERLALGFFNG